MSRWIASLLCLLAAAAPPARARSAPALGYVVRARFTIDPARIEGTVEVHFTNTSRATLDHVLVFLFANRFAQPDAGANDFTRPFLYPREEFNPGAMEITEVSDGETPSRAEPYRDPAVPEGCLVRVPVAPLAPGAERRLALRFRTTVPERFGPFGVYRGELTAVGGWYPYLAALGGGGEWQTERAPPPADYDVELDAPAGVQVVVNDRHFTASDSPVAAHLASVRYVTLIAAADFVRSEADVDGTKVILLRRPAPWQYRLSPEARPHEITLETLARIVRLRPGAVPPPAAPLLAVEAPLRLELTAQGEGNVVISDRTLRVVWLVRPFHEVQLAQALYAELLRPRLAAREGADYDWVSEGVSRTLAQRYVREEHPAARSIDQWIELFNIFSIVDRFESAPQIPFVEAFFERARQVDPLHTHLATFNQRRPPGRVVFIKLAELLGDERLNALLDRCAAAAEPMRECLAGSVPEREIERRLAEWLDEYPSVDYRFDSVELNRREADGFRSEVVVRRVSSRPFHEPVVVRLRTIGGQDVDLRWEGEGKNARLTARTSSRVFQAVIDPDRRLIDDRRQNNAAPPIPQLVLDTAEVEVTSTEFGTSAVAVLRQRYDYRKDLAFAGFITNRGVGFTAGVRTHWGRPIDVTRYRDNAYFFYQFADLFRGFRDERKPGVRTDGHLASIGFRYVHTNIFGFDNPTRSQKITLYADWHDRAVGSDFDYVDWGASLVSTHPLWSPRTVGAIEVFNGFSEPYGGDRVPNQGLYGLGGSRTIRGIGSREDLGRNIFLVRSELRQDLYPEVDLNLLDLLVLRRTQLRFFVDTGRVDASAGRIYDIRGFAAGAGIGLGAIYDFMGFFPALAYIEIATRVDEPSQLDNVQLLFGTRQSF